MSPSGVPGGMFVSNVPANMHGYMPHNSPMQHNMSAFAPVFVPAELQHQHSTSSGGASAGSEQVNKVFQFKIIIIKKLV